MKLVFLGLQDFGFRVSVRSIESTISVSVIAVSREILFVIDFIEIWKIYTCL